MSTPPGAGGLSEIRPCVRYRYQARGNPESTTLCTTHQPASHPKYLPTVPPLAAAQTSRNHLPKAQLNHVGPDSHATRHRLALGIDTTHATAQCAFWAWPTDPMASLIRQSSRMPSPPHVRRHFAPIQHLRQTRARSFLSRSEAPLYLTTLVLGIKLRCYGRGTRYPSKQAALPWERGRDAKLRQKKHTHGRTIPQESLARAIGELGGE
ncbi:hypothetical protein PMIN01_03613 [Paraphaeosphaeria minitans]|uniref:Uncharacterized protein n=1 Tax=Paraphaeosphaeria minitans TaxID=565426 RepID=A0A9P6GNQ5_9PLEO|nr:hypothetical protein PMIN01_03613 [Paraphaeosphaeria minitans]